MIHIGYEITTGKAITIPLTHTFIGGTTGTGKSELLRALIDRTDAKILVLDVKRPRDYLGFGADIPLYIQQRMEAMTLKDLIESTERISIKRELPELSRLCRKSKTWEELLKHARVRQDNPKTRDFYKDVLEVLIVLFERLVDEFNRYHFAEKVELPNKVNVMDLSTLSDQLQQVVVSSVLRYILRYRKNVILVVDEAHRFVPQAQASAARHDVVRVVREGRASHIYVWLGDQTVTGIDKQLMKQMQVWCLARQMELNEAERTLKQIPQRKSLNLTIEAIQTLGLGEFIIVTPKWARRVYVQPTWVPKDQAIAVAKGDVDPETLTQPQEVDEEMEWKERVKALEKRLKEKDEYIRETLREHKKFDENKDKIIKQLESQIHALKETLKRQELAMTVNPVLLEETEDSPTIDMSQPIIQPVLASRNQILEIVDERISQRVLDNMRVVQVPTIKAIHEKIMSDWMDQIDAKFAQLGEAANRAARFIHEKGTCSLQDLLYFVRHRHGKPDAGFNRDYVKPLVDRKIIRKSKDRPVMLHWAVDDQILSQFQEVLEPDEIQQLKQWILSLIL